MSTPDPSPATPTAQRTLVRIEDVAKSYGPIRALRGVSLDVREGEVHGICGHNGAGKSTLVKILIGLVRPDSGRLVLDDHEVTLHNPKHAQASGIAIVDQELSLVPALSVEDNIFLGGLNVPFFHRTRGARREARALLDRLGLRHVPLGAPVERLAIGERQLVEVARLLSRDARLLILDEPTATLSKAEIERVFLAVREVVSQGRSVFFVSHRLDEVFALCHRVSVFRDGECVGTHSIAELDRRALINLILGEMEGAEGVETPDGHHAGTETIAQIRGLTVPGRVRGFSLDLKRSQIVGLAGQIGSGTSDVLRALGGLVPEAGGTLTVGGRRIRLSTPRHTLDGGVLYVSNDRQLEGLFLQQSVERNLVVARLGEVCRAGVISRRRSHRVAEHLAELVGVQEGRLDYPVSSLSGGNQQKVLLGRGLEHSGTSILALDEPTRGVDVGGRADIHRLIRHAAAQGDGVIFASGELDEILELADVIVTMFEGRIVRVLPSSEATAAGLLADMTTAPAATFAAARSEGGA